MSTRREKRAPGIMYWVFEEYINLLSSHFKVASHILSWLALNKPVFSFFFFSAQSRLSECLLSKCALFVQNCVCSLHSI